jgi:hypothetical protein
VGDGEEVLGCCQITLGVPDVIIAHVTGQWGGNLHERNVAEVMSSKRWNDDLSLAADNVANLETDSFFDSFRSSVDVLLTRNNCVCDDFKERRVVPTHYAFRTHGGIPGCRCLKSWLVATSARGMDDGNDLTSRWPIRTFPAAGVMVDDSFGS